MLLFNWTFKYFSENRKIEYLRDKGIMLGTRLRQGRKVYLYMLKDFFVEVVFKNDSLDQDMETLETFSNLNNLNVYLEKEFKTAF